MDDLVRVSPDWRGEMCVDRRGEAIVQIVGRGDRAGAEVARLLHRARRQDAHELVEVGVVRLGAAIERAAEGEGGGDVELEAVLLERRVEAVEGAGLRLRMAAEHGSLREGLGGLCGH